MNKTDLLIGVLIEDNQDLNFAEVCQRYHISEDLLMEMMEFGLFPEQSLDKELFHLNQKALRRMESAFRLHEDLGINLSGIALVLELLEKIERMDQELDILRKHF